MKRILFMLMFIFLLFKVKGQSAFSQYPVYNGTDLGLIYSKTNSLFRIWSPVAEQAQIILYKEGENGIPIKTIDLKKSLGGTWFTKLNGDLKGTFYVFRVMIKGNWSNEVTDPTAFA